ncbi:cation:proton antiporter [Sphingomonas sp. MMS24-JH45]
MVLLLFSIGLELSFRRLWAMRGLVFGTGAAELFGSPALIAIALHVLGRVRGGSAGLGLALALSSTALVLPLVGTTSPVGRGAFGMLLFEDLALVPIIFALGALAPTATDQGWVGLAGTALRGGLTVVAMRQSAGGWSCRACSRRRRGRRAELFLAASLLVVIVASVATTAAGLSPIVGALLAGLLIAETEYHSEVEVITAPFKGLALGVFLITVGMSLDLRLILANWSSLLLAVLGVVAVKTVVTTLLLRVANARPGVAAETGLLMGSPSETTLIVLATAAQAQLILPLHRRLLADGDRDRADHHAAAGEARHVRVAATGGARAGADRRRGDRRRAHGRVRLRPRRADGRRHAGAARPALSGSGGGHRRGGGGARGGLFDRLR